MYADGRRERFACTESDIQEWRLVKRAGCFLLIKVIESHTTQTVVIKARRSRKKVSKFLVEIALFVYEMQNEN